TLALQATPHFLLSNIKFWISECACDACAVLPVSPRLFVRQKEPCGGMLEIIAQVFAVARAQGRAQQREPRTLLVGARVRSVTESSGEAVDPQQRRIDGDAGRGLAPFCIRDREPARPNSRGDLGSRQVAPQTRGPQVGPELFDGTLDLMRRRTQEC